MDPREQRFAALLRELAAGNPFYRERIGDVRSLDRLEELPLTTKDELVADQAAHPPFGSNLTYPLARYARLHQTSGTTGRPLRWLDTPESWDWWLDCWCEVYRAAEVGPEDRVFVAFSFGPFIGFWTAFEAAERIGALALTGGAMDSEQRLQAIEEWGATVVVATPTYALRLAEVARQTGRPLAAGPVRRTIHAGEPGASIPGVKSRIESAWGAVAVDHVGATEVGAWGYGCGHADHVHVLDTEFVAEVVDGELVLTNLGRIGSPVLRYRTGDAVELVADGCPCGRSGAYLPGGVRGRVDDMIVVRGVNIYPSAVEAVIRELPQVEEFEVQVRRVREMVELTVRIEAPGDGEAVRERLAETLRQRLQLRAEVVLVEPGSLPRYELKARRFRYEGRD